MLKQVMAASSINGEIIVPGDKSISHRSVIFNAIANGTARINNFLAGEDCLASIGCMRALGVEIELDVTQHTVTVEGRGLHGLQEAANVLDCGNSGTTTRLLTGLLSGQDFATVLTGDASLRSRPMKRIIGPLQQMGAQIWGRKNDTLAPLAIHASKLKGIEYALPVASAQLKSCLLLAALYADGPTRLSGLIASRDHTERMLMAMGAPLTTNNEEIIMNGPATTLQALDITVPGDISSAAFWLVAAAVHPNADLFLLNVGVNQTRTGVIEVLQTMGADITLLNPRQVASEPVADIRVRGKRLKGTNIGGDLIPRLVDEIPALAVAALFAEGRTYVSQASELRAKETDRIATLASEFGKIGARVETFDDGFSIEGRQSLHGNATLNSYGDHRLAMAWGILGLLLPTNQSLYIEDWECANVSYPGFWDDLDDIEANSSTKR